MTPAVLRVQGLRKQFTTSAGALTAVDDVSFAVEPDEVVGLVGESGSGKSTIGRLVMRLHRPTAGRIWFQGEEITGLDRERLRPFRRRMQMVFQDPYSSLNQRMSIRQILQEPLRVHGVDRGEWVDRCSNLLAMVGLPEAILDSYPHAFSGGQRQRIGIARALAVDPELIVADEPVSALDVSIQAQVLNLLRDVRERLGLAMLFISHDLAVVRHVADRVLVMYLGRIVEEGPVERVFAAPAHPYTEALLSAAPVPAVGARKERILLTGDVPSPLAAPSGCVFRTRCPIAEARCADVRPVLEEVSSGHRKACLVR